MAGPRGFEPRPGIREALGLNQLPHFTTVQKAFQHSELVDTPAQTVLDLHVTITRTHDTQIASCLTERNLEQFETLAADKTMTTKPIGTDSKAGGNAH